MYIRIVYIYVLNFKYDIDGRPTESAYDNSHDMQSNLVDSIGQKLGYNAQLLATIPFERFIIKFK